MVHSRQLLRSYASDGYGQIWYRASAAERQRSHTSLIYLGRRTVRARLYVSDLCGLGCGIRSGQCASRPRCFYFDCIKSLGSKADLIGIDKTFEQRLKINCVRHDTPLWPSTYSEGDYYEAPGWAGNMPSVTTV